jgi:hypothetical protein
VHRGRVLQWLQRIQWLGRRPDPGRALERRQLVGPADARSRAGTADSVFYGISCDQAAACTAAGEYVTSSGATDALAESWDGSTWTVQATPSPSAASVPSSALGGVSCITAAACTAVGEYLSGKHFLTLAERG